MKRSSYSIPIKVFLGYFLLVVVGGLTVWFIYHKAVQLNRPLESETSNKKMALFSQAATRLYNAEGISRNIIQNKDTSGLQDFRKSIDTISDIIGSLKTLYHEQTNRNELDSIEGLLRLKEENLKELLEFRRRNSYENYYQRVLSRIENQEYFLEDTNYDRMINNLSPSQQEIILGYLNYKEKDFSDNLVDRTTDSLVNTVKQVLISLELRERRFQERMTEKENQLLVNDLKISERLSRIRNRIEQEEFQESLERIQLAQSTMDQTSRSVIVFGIIGFLTVLFFLIIIIRDVKRSQEYRVALEKAKIYAERLLKSREQIMATVTHDLRSPLNSILGYSDLLENTELTPKQKNYLKHLSTSSDYTIRLVNDLLDFSQLESGKVGIENLPYNPKELIEDCIHNNIPSRDPKNLKIITDLSPELDQDYMGDPFRMRQILSNLIGNAYKFTEEGFVKINGNILYRGKNSFLDIVISDSGIGISRAQQRLIFEEFSQADSGSEKRQSGFGLGLAISKKLVELLGGTIQVKSELKKGSSFYLKIPVRSVQKTTSKKTVEGKLSLRNTRDKKLLLVDDDPVQLSLIKEITKKQGFQTESANNGKEAVRLLKKNSFEAVLTDIQMPKMDGFELLTAVRKNKKIKNIPILALSGAMDKTESYYLKSGFSDYLLKPYKTNDLLRKIAALLKLELLEEEIKPEEKSNSAPLALPNDLFDLADLKMFTGEDDQALRSILETMVESTESSMEIMVSDAQEEDFQSMSNYAHKMLPMLRQIKASTSVMPLEKLERYKSENLVKEDIERYVAQASAEVGKIMESLKENYLN